jgi:hypothetical protein
LPAAPIWSEIHKTLAALEHGSPRTIRHPATLDISTLIVNFELFMAKYFQYSRHSGFVVLECWITGFLQSEYNLILA